MSTESAPAPPPPPAAAGAVRQKPGSAPWDAREKTPFPSRSEFPISWCLGSPRVRETLAGALSEEGAGTPVRVADLGPGWSPEVPLFFLRDMRGLLESWGVTVGARPVRMYEIDVHPMRVANLQAKLDLEGHTGSFVCGTGHIETMGDEGGVELADEARAALEPRDAVDAELGASGRLQAHAMDVVVLCNDMVGFIADYYTKERHGQRGDVEYSQLDLFLMGVRRALAPGGLLVVSQPGALFPADNIGLLTGAGFRFVEALDVDTRGAGACVVLADAAEGSALEPRLHHYGVLVFEAV